MSRLKTGEDAPVLPVPYSLELLPEQILVDEELNVRPYTDPSDPEEVALIKELAETILRDGQIHPVLVRRVENGEAEEYHLVAGRRRRAAFELINAGLGKEDEPRKVQCRVESNVSVERAKRQALVENIHRRSLSPMDLAYNIRSMREQFGDGRAGAKKIAGELGISIAQVTQTEKFLTLAPEHQKLLGGANPQLSAQGGFDLLDVKPEKRDEVLGKAVAKQEEEEAAGDETTPVVTGVPGKKKAVKRKHVLAAARETEDALQKQKPRTRAEIIEFFEDLNGSAYGFENGAVRLFLTYFTETWCVGAGSDRTLMIKFDAMTDKAPKGTASKAEKEEAPKKAKRSAKPKK